MTDDDKQEFAELMTGLAENFSAKITKVGLKIRFRALEKFTIREVANAAFAIMDSRKYTKMPTHAEFKEHIKGGSADDLGSIQATKVLRAIRSIGKEKSVVFDDATTMAVVAQGYGGWLKLCNEMTVNQEKWFVKDFQKLYKAFTVGNIKHYGVLPGNIESMYTAHGPFYNQLTGKMLVEKPVYIGDRSQCKMIESKISDNEQLVHDKIKALPQIGEQFLLEQKKEK